jgi:hypothetical protein
VAANKLEKVNIEQHKQESVIAEDYDDQKAFDICARRVIWQLLDYPGILADHKAKFKLATVICVLSLGYGSRKAATAT